MYDLRSVQRSSGFRSLPDLNNKRRRIIGIDPNKFLENCVGGAASGALRICDRKSLTGQSRVNVTPQQALRTRISASV